MNKQEAVDWLQQFANEFASRLSPFAAEAGITVRTPRADWDKSVSGCWADVAVVSARQPRLVVDLWLDRWAAEHLQLAYGVGCRQFELKTMKFLGRQLADRYGAAITRSDADLTEDDSWKPGKRFSRPQHYARPVCYGHVGGSSGYCMYVFDRPPFSSRRRNEVLTRATTFALDVAAAWHHRSDLKHNRARKPVMSARLAGGDADERLAEAANEAAEGSSQGFRVGTRERQAIEQVAMERAIA